MLSHPQERKKVMAAVSPWSYRDPAQAVEAREQLRVWPLDEANAAYLDQVHPRGYTASTDTPHVSTLLLETRQLAS
jgi:hypothetical protein